MYPKGIQGLYRKVGLVVGLSQMIEYNLANIISLEKILSAFDKKESMFLHEYNSLAKKANEEYEKLTKSTLGCEITQIENTSHISKETKQELKYVLEKRNHVVHHMFKDDITKPYILDKQESINKELTELIEKMNSLNVYLCSIMDEEQKEFKLIY